MKKSKFTEEQIEAETGTRVAEVCRKTGISEQTFFRWKKKYEGLGVSEFRRLRQLEEEDRQLKRLVANLTLDKQMLQDALSKKTLAPAGKRDLADVMKMAYKVSERRACTAFEFARSVVRYESKADPHTALRMRLRELAMARVGYSYSRLYVLL
jgi:putative transposase